MRGLKMQAYNTVSHLDVDHKMHNDDVSHVRESGGLGQMSSFPAIL